MLSSTRRNNVLAKLAASPFASGPTSQPGVTSPIAPVNMSLGMGEQVRRVRATAPSAEQGATRANAIQAGAPGYMGQTFAAMKPPMAPNLAAPPAMRMAQR